MAHKTEYNTRFSFEDPLSKLSLSRSLCYRIRKRKKLAELQDDELSSSSPIICPESGKEMEIDCFSTTLECSESNTIVDCSPEERSAEDFADEDASSPDYLDDDDVPSLLEKANEHQQTLVKVTSDLEQSLYSGSELTVASSCLLLKKFRMQHRLSETAFADLLRLISLHCP